MRDRLLARVVPLISEAGEEQLVAIARYLESGVSLPGAEGVPASLGKRRRASAGAAQSGAHAQARCYFRRSGQGWQVMFEGGEPFWLDDTLGVRYLNYLLQHPNVPISAFDLEVAIRPEKGEVRSTNSIQPESDAQARKDYREALRRLEADEPEAEAAGEPEEGDWLDDGMPALGSALKSGRGFGDTGERARSNVRKALRVVLAKLGRGGPSERALAEHLGRSLSTGYECVYWNPRGAVWGSG